MITVTFAVILLVYCDCRLCVTAVTISVRCIISAFEWLLMYTKSRAVAEKPHGALVKFDTYLNLQRHLAVLPAIARLSCY